MIVTTISLFMALEAATNQTKQCSQPVFMVVAGETYNRQRMRDYAKAIVDSKLYQKLGGYYLNSPTAIAQFEGEVPKNHATLIVRFPCLANAKAFWNSEVYQTKIKPIREGETPAGKYTVNVYPEIPVRSDIAKNVGDGQYTKQFDRSKVKQLELRQH